MRNIKLEGLRKLGASYWKPFLSLLAVGTTIWDVLKIFGISPVAVQGSTISNSTYWRIAIAIFVYIFIRFPRVAFVVTRIILGKPIIPTSGEMIFRGPRPYSQEDKKSFHGREKDIERCWIQIKEHPFFVVEGESGCGKSSILNVALIPLLYQRFKVIECRVADDPFGRLYYALREEAYRKPERPVSRKTLTEAITAAATVDKITGIDNSSPNPKPLLLCLDQFEEIFVTVKEDVRKHFLLVLKENIRNGNLRLIISLRSDFIDLLIGICRELDPSMETLNIGNYYSLRAFSEEQAKEVLDALLAPFYKDDPLLKQQFEDFGAALARELLRPSRDRRLCPDDYKSVLPVELQTVGMMMESVGRESFSASALRLKGGKTGLLRDFVVDAKTYVWIKTGISGDQALLILRQLISPAHTKWIQTAKSISSALNIPHKQVESVLEAFGEKYLVNRLPGDNGGKGEGGQALWKYELMHEHLVQVLIEAPDPALQKARDAEERLLFWMKRTEPIFADSHPNKAHSFKSRLTSWFAQPIPVVENLRLWRYARAGSESWMLSRNFRGFAARLFALGIMPLLIAFVSWSLWTRTDSYVIHRVKVEAPILQIASEQGEDLIQIKRNSWTVTKNRGRDISEWFKAMVFDSDLTNALVLAANISVARSRAAAYIGIVEGLQKTERTPQAEKTLVETITAAIAAAREINDTEDRAYALGSIAAMLGDLGQSPKTMKALADVFASAREIKNDSDRASALSSIARVLGEMGRSPETVKALADVFASAREIKNDSDRASALSSIARVLGEMGRSPETVKVLADVFTSARELETQYDVFISITRAMSKMGRSPEIEAVLTEIITIVRGDKFLRVRAKTLRVIAETMDKMGMEEADKVMKEAIAAARKIEDKGDRVGDLTSIAKALGKIDMQQADTVLKEASITAREIESRYHRAVALEYIAEARATLGNALETQKALAEVIAAVRDIEKESEQSYFFLFFPDDLVKMGHTPEVNKPLNDAFIVAREIKDESERAEALGWFASALGRRGLAPETDKILADIFAVAREIKDEYKRAEVLHDIAFALGRMAKSPETEKALTDIFADARELKDEGNRGSVLNEIALSLSKVDLSPKTDEFLANLRVAANEIKSDYNFRSRVLAAIAMTSAVYGNYHLSYSMCNGEQCAAPDKLQAFTAILMEHAKRQNPDLRRRLETVAKENEAEEDE